MVLIGVVDDKQVNRRTVERNLATCNGFNIVLQASNGEDFMEQMEEIGRAHV